MKTVKKKIIKHLVIGCVSIIFLFGTLFIKQPGELPHRLVYLGYPFYFYTLDFSGNQGSTHMSGAPNAYIARWRFNIFYVWEEFGQINWSNLILSYLIIFLLIEVSVIFMTHPQIRTGNK